MTLKQRKQLISHVYENKVVSFEVSSLLQNKKDKKRSATRTPLPLEESKEEKKEEKAFIIRKARHVNTEKLHSEVKSSKSHRAFLRSLTFMQKKSSFYFYRKLRHNLVKKEKANRREIVAKLIKVQKLRSGKNEEVQVLNLEPVCLNGDLLKIEEVDERS